jgi:hypothetical protein
MSIPWLTISALLVGFATYRLFYTLVKPVRILTAFVFMAGFIVIVQNLETFGHQWNSSAGFHLPFFSDRRTPNIPNPNEQSGPLADVAFQSTIREDHNFLDEFIQQQIQTGQPPENPTSLQVQGIGKDGIVATGAESRLKVELAINTVQVRRAEPVPHKETVKRAQLVTQNEPSKHAEQVRSRQR